MPSSIVPSQAAGRLQEWADHHTDINTVLELVDILVDLINEPVPERLLQRARQIPKKDLFTALQLSITALKEWEERHELASHEARQAVSKTVPITAAQHVKLPASLPQLSQLQVPSVTAAKTADASQLRRELIKVTEAIQRLRNSTRVFEGLVGRKVVVDGIGRLLSTAETASRVEEFLGVESIDSLSSG